MAALSTVANLTNTLFLILGWVILSHTIVQNLSCLSTNWNETWLEVVVLSVGIMFAAVGLRGLLRSSERNEKGDSGSVEGRGERTDHMGNFRNGREECELSFGESL
jgi:hypothetical protein